MSCLENEQIEEAAFESFMEEFERSHYFANTIRSLYTDKQIFSFENYAVDEIDFIVETFRKIWNYDNELLTRNNYSTIQYSILKGAIQ